MNKWKKYGLLVFTIVMISLCGCSKKEEINQDMPQVAESAEQTITESTEKAEAVETESPKIAYIDEVAYYGTDEICEIVPRKAPDGTIETFVPKEIMPDAYHSANFGSELGKLEYIFLDEGQLIIHIDENWYYFLQQE